MNAAGQEQKSGEENKEPQQKEEKKELQTVRFSEVIRSIFYAPNYVALEQGFFEEEGLKVDMVTSQGSDKGAAALLAGTADISLIGPETTIYINKEKGAKKIKVFYQLTATDGSFLLSRNKIDNFDWSQLNGEKIISWRPGSAPQMVMASVLKKNNVEAELITNIAAPAMVGAYSQRSSRLHSSIRTGRFHAGRFGTSSFGCFSGQSDGGIPGNILRRYGRVYCRKSGRDPKVEQCRI